VTGAAACGVTGLLCVWSLVAAVRVAPPPAPAPDLIAPPAVAPAVRAGRVDLSDAWESDPFRSDRRRPPRRFVLPGTAAAPAARPPAPAVALTLNGTVVYPGGGGFALVGAAGRAPVMVRVGEVIEGLTLRSVARDEATFARPGGGSMVLRVPKAGGQ
jgi:hypothetical protein